MKFSIIARTHLVNALSRDRGDDCCAKYSLKHLRPCVRAMLLKIAAGERIPPEYIRVVLGGCVKAAALRAVVYTIPSKAKGLRVQTTDIILGEPGVGKGSAFQWRDDLIQDVKKNLMEYAAEELKAARSGDNGPVRVVTFR